MALQSALLRLLAICTLIVTIATIILADDADGLNVQDNTEEAADLADEVYLEKREIAQDFLDFLRTRKLDSKGRQRKPKCLVQGATCSTTGPRSKIIPCCSPMGCYDIGWGRCTSKETCVCMRRRYTVDSF